METEYQKSEGTGKRNTENSERLFQMLAFQQNNQSDLSKRATEADRIFLPAFFVPFFDKKHGNVVAAMKYTGEKRKGRDGPLKPATMPVLAR